MTQRTSGSVAGYDPIADVPVKLSSQLHYGDVKALLGKFQMEVKNCIAQPMPNTEYSYSRELDFLNQYTLMREREREEKERTVELKRRFRRRVEDDAKRAAEQQQQQKQQQQLLLLQEEQHQQRPLSGNINDLKSSVAFDEVDSSAILSPVQAPIPVATKSERVGGNTNSVSQSAQAPVSVSSRVPPAFAPSGILQPIAAPCLPTATARPLQSNSTAVVGHFDIVRDVFDEIELNAIDDKREALSALQTALSGSQGPLFGAQPNLSGVKISLESDFALVSQPNTNNNSAFNREILADLIGDSTSFS